jgi:hypothetical protein
MKARKSFSIGPPFLADDHSAIHAREQQQHCCIAFVRQHIEVEQR